MRPEVTTFQTGQSRRRFLGVGAGALVAAFLSGAGRVEAGHGDSEGDGAPFSSMTADKAYEAVQTGEIILVDIRRPDEWLATSVAEGAIGLDMRDDGFVPALVALRQANPETPIALICRTGARSAYVTSALAGQGFPGLVDVSEGMAGGSNGPGWLKRGLPTYDGTMTNVVARRNALLP